MTAKINKRTIRIGLAQLNSGDSKDDNLNGAEKAIRVLADQGAELIVLPEHSDFIGADDQKRDQAESIDNSRYLGAIRSLAVELQCHIHIGSFLEKDAEQIYNCGVVFNPDGELLARYRKMHLFDVEIPGGKKYLESALISSGRETVTFSIGDFTFGMATCYDLRFPELFRRLARSGVNVMLLPAAFTLQTGRDHWQVLLRARAIENLCWVVGVGQWGQAPPNHLSYGRSMVINPWGLTVAQAPDGVSTLTAELDLQTIEETRTRFPALDHVRDDVFTF